MGIVTLETLSVGDEPIREIASVWAMLPATAKSEAIKKAEKFRTRVRNLSWDASLATKFHATLANLNGHTPELSVLKQRLEQCEEAIERTGMVREPGSDNCRQEYRQRDVGEVDYVVLDSITATILIDYFRRNAEPQLPEDDESGEIFESLKRLGKIDTTENLAGSLVLHLCHLVSLLGNRADLRTLGEIFYLNWPGCVTRVCEVLRKSFKRRPKNLPPLISKWMSKIDDIHFYTTNYYCGADRHETRALADEPPFDAATESTPIVVQEKTRIDERNSPDSDSRPIWIGPLKKYEFGELLYGPASNEDARRTYRTRVNQLQKKGKLQVKEDGAFCHFEISALEHHEQDRIQAAFDNRNQRD